MLYSELTLLILKVPVNMLVPVIEHVRLKTEIYVCENNYVWLKCSCMLDCFHRPA